MADRFTAPEIWRISTTADGTSALERVSLTMATGARAGTMSALLAGAGSIFRWMPPGMDADWHTAPRRQLAATLAGLGEVVTDDGQSLVLRPGVVTLLEDLTGQGHITRTHGDDGMLVVFLPLDDATVIA